MRKSERERESRVVEEDREEEKMGNERNGEGKGITPFVSIP